MPPRGRMGATGGDRSVHGPPTPRPKRTRSSCRRARPRWRCRSRGRRQCSLERSSAAAATGSSCADASCHPTSPSPRRAPRSASSPASPSRQRAPRSATLGTWRNEVSTRAVSGTWVFLVRLLGSWSESCALGLVGLRVLELAPARLVLLLARLARLTQLVRVPERAAHLLGLFSSWGF